jgi:hypothetical protein
MNCWPRLRRLPTTSNSQSFFNNPANLYLTTTEGLNVLHLAAWLDNADVLGAMVAACETDRAPVGYCMMQTARQLCPLHFAVVARADNFLKAANYWQQQYDEMGVQTALQYGHEPARPEFVAKELYGYGDAVSDEVFVCRPGDKPYWYNDAADIARTTVKRATKLANRALGISPPTYKELFPRAVAVCPPPESPSN